MQIISQEGISQFSSHKLSFKVITFSFSFAMRIRLCTLAANSWGRLWQDAFRNAICIIQPRPWLVLCREFLAQTEGLRALGHEGMSDSSAAFKADEEDAQSHLTCTDSEWVMDRFWPDVYFSKPRFSVEHRRWTHPNPATAQAELPGWPVQPSNKSAFIHTSNQHSFNWSFNNRFVIRGGGI